VGSTDGFVRVYTMDTSDGSLSAAGELDTGSGLDFIAVGPDDRTVFVSYNGSVSAFGYDPASEMLTLLDSATTFGVGTHVAVDPTGKYVFVAHYSEGALSFLPYAAGSGFGTATEFSPGNNAHQVRIDAAGTHVYVPCLGSDHVAQYTLDPVGGVLSPQSTPTVAAGNGPRHMDFHPSAPVAYVLDELASEIHVFDIEGGSLVPRPGDSVFTSEDEQSHQSSDIQVTPDGSFVYAVNRQPSELVTFRVEADHTLTRLGADDLTGVVRSFGVDPAGQYLQIGGNDGRLAALRIDEASGVVTETSAETGLGDIHATVVRYLTP
jgi:6-phosphogluconolactonase